MSRSAASVGREIGMWTAVALVMGNMIGSGVFLLPASLAPYGGLSLAGWTISAGGSILLALVFARLARLAPDQGGLYAYTRRTFGDLPGFLVAWGYWISIWSALSALAVAFVGYLDPFIPSIVRDRQSSTLLAIGMVWLMLFVNMRGVGLAGRVQVVTTVLKVLPLVAIALAGLALLAPERLAMPETESFAATGRSVMAVVTLTLWAFLGLESGSIPADRIQDPGRTIPRAIIVGTLLTTGLYIAGTVGVMSLVPADALATSTAPFADAARTLWGDWAASAVALGAAVSCLGALNGWSLMAGQLPLAVARDGLFPTPFARLSSRGTPTGGLVIAGVLTTGLVALNASGGLVELFTFIILLSTLSSLVPYAFCSLASLLTAEPAGDGRPGVPRGAAVIGALAFVYSLIAIGGAGADVVYWGFLLLIAGLPVYVWVVGPSAVRRGP